MGDEGNDLGEGLGRNGMDLSEFEVLNQRH